MKKRCEDVIMNIYKILDGKTSNRICRALEEHLKQCERCAREYKELEELVRLCNRFPKEEIPEEDKVRIKENLLSALNREMENNS